MLIIVDALAGLLLGMCYDLLKAFRHTIKKKVLDVLLDLTFWGISLGLCIWLFLLTGDKKFRFYEFWGMSAGFVIYFFVISEYFVIISKKIADFFLFFLKIPFTILKYFAIMIKNGVLFLFSPFFRVMHLGKKRMSSGMRKLKQTLKLMKRI